MKTRRVLVRGHREYKAFILRLKHNKIKLVGMTCANLLSVIDLAPMHRVYVYHDKSIRVITYSDKLGNHFSEEFIIPVEAYTDKVNTTSNMPYYSKMSNKFVRN